MNNYNNNGGSNINNTNNFPRRSITGGAGLHMASHSPQIQGGSQFPGHFQPSDPHHTQAQSPNPVPAGNNSNVPGPTVSTPGTGAKRASQKPPSRLSGGGGGSSLGHGQGGGMASLLKTMELTPVVRRRKRKLPEKEIPDKVAAALPESALYTQLLELESRADALLARKKAEIFDMMKDPPCLRRTLRIYVFNTYANQGKSQTENDGPPSWSLKIIGRILEDGVDPAASGSFERSKCPLDVKFSSFFKKITIYLDQGLYPDNHVILWESSRSPALHDGFEVKRKGDKEFTVIIRMEMDYFPEKYKLSSALQEVLGIEVETRSKILIALWQYIKTRKLQIPGETSSFICDAQLRQLFGEEKLKFSAVPQKITQHLSAPQAIHLEHKIKLSGDCPAGYTCYDILVDVPFPVNKEMSNFMANLEKNKEIDVCDETICAAIKKIHEHHQRRAFFLGFSQSPAEFINSLITSQARDLKLVGGDANNIAEKERRSEFYSQPWIEDAVIRYLNRKPVVSGDAAGSK